MRSKKALIQSFIAGINNIDDVKSEWNTFVAERREADLTAIVAEEQLKPQETRKFLENAFRDGEFKTTGTEIDKLMPPISRFGHGTSRREKKQRVIEKLKAFFDCYLIA